MLVKEIKTNTTNGRITVRNFILSGGSRTEFCDNGSDHFNLTGLHGIKNLERANKSFYSLVDNV